MIATVKIAPVERWCDTGRKYAESDPVFTKLVGRETQIITESCRPAKNCDSGREWQVPNEVGEKQFDEIGVFYFKGTKFWICEHMLEMD